jgi:hypothetical protein
MTYLPLFNTILSLINLGIFIRVLFHVRALFKDINHLDDRITNGAEIVIDYDKNYLNLIKQLQEKTESLQASVNRLALQSTSLKDDINLVQNNHLALRMEFDVLKSDFMYLLKKMKEEKEQK